MKRKVRLSFMTSLALLIILSACVDSDTSFEVNDPSVFQSEALSEIESTDQSEEKADSTEEVSQAISQIYKDPGEYARYGLADSVEKVSDSVVSISVTSSYSGGFYGNYVVEESGSGVIVSDNGYIVTNYHVIEGAENIKVVLSNNNEYDSQVIGVDSKTDLAVIKIQPDENLVPAVFGDSSDLRRGDFVFSVGNALGEYPGSVSMGIVSYPSRAVIINDETITMIQTDASLNSGNSGGGLFDSQGCLVGVVSAKEGDDDAEGVGFAIPSHLVRPVIDDIIQYGYVTGRPTLGFQTIDITSMREAQYYGLDWIGVYISRVDTGSNGEKAGLKSKDYIYSVNGEVITTSDRLEEILEESAVGDQLLLEIWRENNSIDVVLIVGEVGK